MSNEKSTQPSSPSLRDLTHEIARRLSDGQSQAALVRQLVERGWPEPSAAHFVANATHMATLYAARAKRRRAYTQHSRDRIVRGILGVVAGACFIAVSLVMADITVGFVQFAAGIALCLMAPRDLAAGARAWLTERKKH